MSRDLIVLPDKSGQYTVIATDCTGACGQKEHDAINVSYKTLAYYTARVAFLELLCVHARPTAYTLSSFMKNGYDAVISGISALLKELTLDDLPFIASTETNFDMIQSALAVSVIGTLDRPIDDTTDGLSFASIGTPMVGNEVIEHADRIIQMDAFLSLVNDTKALRLASVGSKGIAYKLKQVFGVTAVSCALDLQKSAGPATCVILGYNKKDEAHFISKLQNQFYPISTD